MTRHDVVRPEASCRTYDVMPRHVSVSDKPVSVQTTYMIAKWSGRIRFDFPYVRPVDTTIGHVTGMGTIGIDAEIQGSHLGCCPRRG